MSKTSFRFTYRGGIIFLIFAALNTIQAQSKVISVSKIPASTEEFTAMRNEIATTPEGGAVMTLVALMAMKENRDLGLQFLTIAISRDNISSGSVYHGYAPSSSVMYHIKRLNGRNIDPWSYMPFAYVEGASAQNNYTVDAPYKFNLKRNRYSGSEKSGKVKVFVEVYGFSPRPVSVVQNQKGIWKSKEFSSLFLDVPPPASSKPVDDL